MAFTEPGSVQVPGVHTSVGNVTSVAGALYVFVIVQVTSPAPSVTVWEPSGPLGSTPVQLQSPPVYPAVPADSVSV